VDEALLARIQRAYEAADLDVIGALLDPNVRWGAPGDPIPTCRSRSDVLAWYGRARAAGVRARVTEVSPFGDRVLLGLAVASGGGSQERWQVLTTNGGLVTEIVGFDTKEEAVALASSGNLLATKPPWPIRPPSAMTSGTTQVRPPRLDDAERLRALGRAPTDEGWLPLPDDATAADCDALIGDWRSGWQGGRSFHGPALLVTTDPETVIGHVGLGIDARGVVEIAYGIAPGSRRQGHATRAVRLVVDWLLLHDEVTAVEAIVAADALASKRVAIAAGLTRAGSARQHVGATGESYEDHRYVRTRG
jgi:RimJ/RimL family protein N-acetyltransferase